MKFFTYILIITVGFLNIKPGIDALQLSQDCCTADHCSPFSEEEEPNQQEEKDCEKMCNPFQACISCVLICMSETAFSKAETAHFVEQFFGYSSFTDSPFASDFWHPPKLA